MIFLRLSGGLGNQLFQLSYAVNLACQYEIVYVIGDALGLYKTSRNPDFLNLINSQTIIFVANSNLFIKFFVVFARIGLYLPIFGINDRNFLVDKPFGVSRSSISLKILDGYFQSFSSVQNLTKIFDLVSISFDKNFATSQHIASLLSQYECCIHVRGGDFLLPQNHIYNICNNRYYIDCVKILHDRGVRSFLLLSDDNLASERLKSALSDVFISAEFHSQSIKMSATDEMLLISHFPLKIISNSTFAWWGACFSALFSVGSLTIAPGLFSSKVTAPVLPCNTITVSPLH